MDGNAPQQFHDSLSEVYEFAPEQREKKKKRPRRSASQNGRVISRAEAYRWHLHRSSPRVGRVQPGAMAAALDHLFLNSTLPQSWSSISSKLIP